MLKEENKAQDGKGEAPATDSKAPVGNAGKKTESKLKKAEKPAEGTVVEFSDKIWIQGTGNSKHLPADKKVEVNRTHGEHLIKKGAAKETTAPPKPQPKPAGKKSKDEDEDD